MGACFSDAYREVSSAHAVEACGGNSTTGSTVPERNQSQSRHSTATSTTEWKTCARSRESSSMIDFSTGSEKSEDSTLIGGRILPHSNLRVYTLVELKKITRDFKAENLLGEGGFGKVYKGWVNHKTLAPSKSGQGKMVAVKKLNSTSMQGWQEWQSEVIFLGRLSHPNLVKLLGYGQEEDQLLLVYEFMSKGSLENHLFRRGSASHVLSWNQRIKIATDAAHGLAFLHESDRKIIYRDFKASNILLDMHYNAKIADFGLAKEGPDIGESHVSTRVMGTYGYVAPEYATTGHLYIKSDVYGFGVVLLELLTGLRAVDMNRRADQRNLVTWARPFLADRRKNAQIMDPQLDHQYPRKLACQTCQLASRCIALDPLIRPSMSDVVEILERIIAVEGETRREVKVFMPPRPGARNPTERSPQNRSQVQKDLQAQLKDLPIS